MDLAFAHVEVDMVVGGQAPKRLTIWRVETSGAGICEA